MGKPETCSPQRLCRLLDPPSLNDLRCHNQVKPETYLLIGHLQFLFIDPRIQLREDMLIAHGQARDLFSTETSQAAGPSRPTSPFAAPPSHVNRFDSEDNLVDQWGNIIDMNAVEFEVCHEDQQEGHDLVFNMSTPTRGLVRDIQQQQRRGENELDLCLNICYMYLSFSVRIRSEDKIKILNLKI